MKQRLTLACTLALTIIGPAHAESLSFVDDAWETIGVPGTTETLFQVGHDGSLSVISNTSVAFRYRETDIAGHMLSWRWRIDQMGPPSNLLAVGADDRPIAVHLWFPEQDDQTSLFGTLAELFGYPRVGNALTYVWGGTDDHERVLPNPHLAEGQGALIVLQTENDTRDGWTTEKINIRTDFKTAFGKEAPRPSHIAISGDSDDLGGERSARIADLRFTVDE